MKQYKEHKKKTKAQIAEEFKITSQDIVLEEGDFVTVMEEDNKLILFIEDKTEKAIKDFIETDWSKDEESAGKAINLLKGLVYSDDEAAKKFIKDLDVLSNTLEVEDYVSE